MFWTCHSFYSVICPKKIQNNKTSIIATLLSSRMILCRITQLLLLLSSSVFLLFLQESNAWVSTASTSTPSKQSNLIMEVKSPPYPASKFSFVSNKKHTSSFLFNDRLSQTRKNKRDTQAQSWQFSIRDDSMPCTYMPFWSWQLSYFQKHLNNFKEISIPDPKFELVKTNTTRVITKWFTSDEYRLIRMTYMDAGSQTQVFTSVCYPRANLPVLGTGLLECTGGRRVAIVDFQPLEESHVKYESILAPIRNRFQSLQQPLSDHFFGQSKYFSNQLLLGRFQLENAGEMWKELWPAYKSCYATHVELTKSSRKEISKRTLKNQAEYDNHIASRDPAFSMLSSTFGKEKAQGVVYQAMFPLATTTHKSLDSSR